MKKYIVAIDQGTTSSRTLIFDTSGRVVATAQLEFTQYFPKPGWVEHDPVEIWETQRQTIVRVLSESGISAAEIIAVGVTNQRETTVIWDRVTGEPVMNAIVWQDRRTAEFCRDIRSKHGQFIHGKTGLEVDAYFSASKINWMLGNVAGLRERATRGELAFGTIDSWLIWKLTSGKTHVTDVSNASRTMLLDLNSLRWDRELLELFGVPASILPEIVDSAAVVGDVNALPELRGVPIAGIAGDQQAALFGQRCVDAGLAKNTYGTGCFLLQNTGAEPVFSKNRMLTTVAWRIGNHTNYALEGSVFIAGAAVQWLRDALGVISSAGETETIAASLEDNDGVYFVPAFTGLGAPYWEPDARGTIVGLTRGTGRAHIVRAALEAVCYQTMDVVSAMNEDGATLRELRVDGGGARNDWMMQFQADVLGIPVVRHDVTESTALGAAFLAGIGAGFWSSPAELPQLDTREIKQFSPRLDSNINAWREGWRQAVKKVI